MPPAPEALLLLLDAAVTDDDGLMRCLFRRFPLMAKRAADLTNDERDSICASPYTNHFYTCAGKYGLVIEDRPTVRALVQECNLNEHIFWGGNTDPVQFATIADIVDCMHKTSPKDRRVLSLMEYAPNEESRRRKKPRPSASAVEADDYATAVRLASIAWLLKSLELWPKDAGHDAGKVRAMNTRDARDASRDAMRALRCKLHPQRVNRAAFAVRPSQNVPHKAAAAMEWRKPVPFNANTSIEELEVCATTLLQSPCALTIAVFACAGKVRENGRSTGFNQ
jgi:hypothetical protein